MDWIDLYLNGLPYAIGISLGYHYLNIIAFMCWIVTQPKLDCMKFTMPFGLPCTIVVSEDGRRDWIPQVFGNLFLVSLLLVFLSALWPAMVLIGIPIWLVASARDRLYKGEQQ